MGVGAYRRSGMLVRALLFRLLAEAHRRDLLVVAFGGKGLQTRGYRLRYGDGLGSRRSHGCQDKVGLI